MKDVTQEFKAEMLKESNRPTFLYVIKNYDGLGNDLRLAEHPTDITFNGNVYPAFPIQHESISENKNGEVDTLKIRIGNVSRMLEGYLSQYEWRGKEVQIIMVWLNHLDDPDNFASDSFFIDTYVSDQRNIEFSLSSKFSVLSATLPTRTYSRSFCRWKFKTAECGYTGSEGTCNKTLSRCRQLANQVRFGAFPSVPVRRMYVQ